MMLSSSDFGCRGATVERRNQEEDGEKPQQSKANRQKDWHRESSEFQTLKGL